MSESDSEERTEQTGLDEFTATARDSADADEIQQLRAEIDSCRDYIAENAEHLGDLAGSVNRLLDSIDTPDAATADKDESASVGEGTFGPTPKDEHDDIQGMYQ